ncbi:MAG: hypothetical protein WB973_16775 [Thermoanaerobaculia bacterium]
MDHFGHYIDPRNDPKPPFRGANRLAASHASELVELLPLIRRGRVYDVELWIKAGRPIHAESYQIKKGQTLESPFRAAMRSQQEAIALLLLCNGYPAAISGDLSPWELLEAKNRLFFDLLVQWGADLAVLDPAYVLDAGDGELIDRCYAAGVDFTNDHALARFLAEHSFNKAAYGWAKRHRDDPRIQHELTLGLVEAASHGRERAVALLMWAGAEAHLRVQDLEWKGPPLDDKDLASAVETALICGYGKLIPLLKPDPARCDFDALWSWVSDVGSLDYLAGIQRPQDWSRTIVRTMQRLASEYGDHAETRRCFDRMLQHYGARLTRLAAEDLKYLRSTLGRSKSPECHYALTQLARGERCDPVIFKELTRTPSVRRHVARAAVPAPRRYW